MYRNGKMMYKSLLDKYLIDVYGKHRFEQKENVHLKQ